MGKRSTDAADYESDGGFVEDAPKSKKAKTEKERKVDKSATAKGSGASTGKSGDMVWEISSTRRIGVSEYKGKTMVDIREYYEKDGQSLPGKKGISLTLEQYNNIMSVLPKIEAALAKKGAEVSRPDFGDVGAGGDVEEEEDDNDDDDDDEDRGEESDD